jgi:hypothetical protein
MESSQRAAANAQVMAALGLGGPAGASPAPTAAPSAAGPGIPDRIVSAESGGVPTATNPNSTAAGPGQFLDSTWLETVKKNRPDLAAGKDDATLLAMRTDPAQAGLSRDMTDAYAKQNSGTLAAAGLPVTPGTTYLAHFAGPGGATKILSADPATPVSALLSPAAIQANPQIANMSAGDLRAWADKKMGGAAPDASPAVGAIASALNGAPSGAPTSAAGAAPAPGVASVAKALSAPAGAPAAPLAGPAGVGANPNAKAIAAVLTSPWVDPAVKAQVVSQTNPSFGFQTLPDGTILRTNPKTGQVEPVYQAATKPSFGEIGEGLGGTKQFGFRDEANKKVYDVNGNLVTGATGAGGIPKNSAGEPMQGQELLEHMKKTNPDAASTVEAVIRGDASVTGRNLQKYLPLATLVDPTLQQFNYDSRKKTELDYNSAGKSGLNIKSLNTVGGHLDKMMDAYDKMGNVRIPLANTVKNAVGSGFGGGAPGAFETAATGVANELGTVFRSHGMSDSEVKSWRDRISSSASPEQFRENMSMLLDMLKTRRDVLGEQYKSGSGKDLAPQTFSKLDTAIEKINKRLSPQDQAATPEAAPVASAAPPANPKEGEEFTFKQGVGVFRNGKWTPKGGPSG